MQCRVFELAVDDSGHAVSKDAQLDPLVSARCKGLAAFKVRLSQGAYEGIDVYMQQFRRIEQIPTEQPNGSCIYLHAGLNQLASVEGIAGFPHLVYCDLTSNLIHDMRELASLKYLQYADLGSNAIADVPLFPPQSLLRYLNLSANMLHSLDGLSQLLALEELDISHNPMLTSLSPLESLTQLRKLHIQSCQVTSIQPLSKLANLQEVNTMRNKISNLADTCAALDGMTGLEVLVLKGNPVEGDNSYMFSIVDSARGLKLFDWSPVTDEIRSRVDILRVRQEKRVYVAMIDEWYSAEAQKTSQVVEHLRVSHRAKEQIVEDAARLRMQRAEKELNSFVHHIIATVPKSTSSNASHSEKLFDEWEIGRGQELPQQREQTLRRFIDGRLAPKINPAELFQKLDSDTTKSSRRAAVPPLPTEQVAGADSPNSRRRRRGAAAETLSASALSFLFRSQRTSRKEVTPRTDNTPLTASDKDKSTPRSESVRSTPRIALQKLVAASAFGFRRRSKRESAK